MKNKLWAWILIVLILIQCIPMNIFAVEDVIYLEDQSYTYVNPEYADIVDNEYLLSYTQYDPVDLSEGNEEYLSDTEQLGAIFREGLIARESQIVIYYAVPYDGGNENLFSDATKAIWEEATKHTGIPNGGDYISHNGTGFSATGSGKVIGGIAYYDIVFLPFYFTTAEQEAEVDAEVDRVLGEIITEGMDDYQKVKAIYDYICANITYDYANLNDSSYMLKHSAYAALINKTAVCQGYALLFYRMALEVGVDARYISGIGGGGPHGWNIVELDELYYNLDSTWDAGSSRYDYFLKSNANFGDHTRDSEYNSTAFITKYPMDTEDYVYEEKPSASNECGDGVTWNFAPETGTLYINYTGSGTGEMYGYTTWEPSPWNEYNNKITKCIIDEGVTSIGVKAFEYCSLSEVSLPSSLKSIGDWAFYGCEKLRSIALPDGLLSVGNSAFTVSGLTEVTIPASLATLGEYAFGFCHSLTQVTFKGNVPNSWGDDAIIESATIYYSEGTTGWTTPTWTAPDGTVYNTKVVAKIIAGGYCGAPFFNSNLTWTLDSAGTLTIFGEGEMMACGELTEFGLGIGSPWNAYLDKITTCIVGEGVTTLGDLAFCGCKKLTSVVLPNSLTSIGAYAFAKCFDLTALDIPDGVITIGDGAFMECKKITNISIPDGVTTIGLEMFKMCDNLTNVYLPNSITTIDDYAFELCNKLTSINIPNGVTKIGDSAFFCCGSLTSINIPNGVTKIGDHTFYSCGSLTSINIPNGVTKIGDFAFTGCINLTNIYIPDGVTTIGEWTFGNCEKLQSISLPKNLTKIGDLAFTGCKLPNVNIPNTVTTIGYCAFNNCLSLETITFNGDVPKEWGERAIPLNTAIYYTEGSSGWTSPSWISPDGYVYSTQMLSKEKKTISGIVTSPKDIDGDITIRLFNVIGYRAYEIDKITLGEGNYEFIVSKGTYKLEFSKYGCIPEEITVVVDNEVVVYNAELEVAPTKGECGSGVTWQFDLNTRTLSINYTGMGEGKIESSSWSQYYANYILKCIVGNGITMIGDYVFALHKNMTNVVLPESLTTIGNDAFNSCENLISIDIPEGVTAIGNSAFNGCKSLASINIPKGVTVIDDYAFYACESLTSIDIPDGVTRIGNYAFFGCSYLTSVIFNGNVPNSWGVNAIMNSTIYYNEGTTGWTTPTWTAPDGTVYNTVMLEPAEPEKKGDLDGNGVVDVDDVLLCLDLAFIIPTKEQLEFADLDANGVVDVDDVLICLDLCFA